MSEAAPPNSPTPYYRGPRVVKRPGLARVVASRLLLPVLALASVERSEKLGLVPLDDERVLAALPHVRGRLLDVGCGSNTLVRTCGQGVGVDVFPWEGVDQVIEDAARLPFEDGTFDTLSYLACLNHIGDRKDALKEGFRVLRSGGTLIVTMLSPAVGRFVHWLRRSHDPDHQGRGSFEQDELMGMSVREVSDLIAQAGFRLESTRTFVWRLNRIYVARKPEAGG